MASSPKSTRSFTYVVWGLAIVVVALGVYAIRSLTQPKPTVGTADVAYQDLVKTSPTNGKVQPIGEFKLTAQAAGQVEDIYVKLGQRVNAVQTAMDMQTGRRFRRTWWMLARQLLLRRARWHARIFAHPFRARCTTCPCRGSTW